MRLVSRKHRARLKRNRRFYWGRDLLQEPGMLSRTVETPCTCSCWMCRPRKYDGETMQERRAKQDDGLVTESDLHREDATSVSG